MEAPSPHEGSKPRFIHHTDVAQDAGRKPRPARGHADPMPFGSRLASYGGDRQHLTPAQLSRLRHKHGRNVTRIMLGYDPAEREAERVQEARRAAHARRAAAQLRRIVPRGPLDAVHGQALGRRRWRVAESAPSEWVR